MALSLTLAFIVAELTGFLTGLSMFTALPSIFCILECYVTDLKYVGRLWTLKKAVIGFETMSWSVAGTSLHPSFN